MAELNLEALEDRIEEHLGRDKEIITVCVVNELLKESLDNNARTFTFTDAGEKGLQVDVTYQDKESKTTYLPSKLKTAIPTRIKIMCGLDFTQKVNESKINLEVSFVRNEYDLTKHQYFRHATYDVSFSNGCQVELNKLDLYQQDLIENVLNETEFTFTKIIISWS